MTFGWKNFLNSNQHVTSEMSDYKLFKKRKFPELKKDGFSGNTRPRISRSLQTKVSRVI